MLGIIPSADFCQNYFFSKFLSNSLDSDQAPNYCKGYQQMTLSYRYRVKMCVFMTQIMASLNKSFNKHKLL